MATACSCGCRDGRATSGRARRRSSVPRLSPLLPLTVPEPVANGEPAEGFPFPWAIFTWVDGANATVDAVNPAATAEAVGAFLVALRGIDGDNASPGLRRGTLATQDERTRAGIAQLADRHDTDALLAVWEVALTTPAFDGPPTWCHCDLDLRNVLFASGKPCGLVDFGSIGAGDPASDDAAAFKLLPADARDAFWATVGADDTSI